MKNSENEVGMEGSQKKRKRTRKGRRGEKERKKILVRKQQKQTKGQTKWVVR